MAYIGRDPAYGSFEKQALTADSSTTTFNLNYTVGSSSSILVSVAGVHQEPEVAYNLASGGTQIVFTAAPTTGDTVFIIFLGIAYDAGELLSTGTITNKTALTTGVEGADTFLVYDDSAVSLKKLTLANLVTGLTELSAQAATNDVLLIYDTDAGEIKKIQQSNISPTLSYTTRNATGDGVTTDFTVTSGVTVDDVLVFENGICQKPTTDYTISGTTLTFSTAPANGVAIQIRELP